MSSTDGGAFRRMLRRLTSEVDELRPAAQLEEQRAHWNRLSSAISGVLSTAE